MNLAWLFIILISIHLNCQHFSHTLIFWRKLNMIKFEINFTDWNRLKFPVRWNVKNWTELILRPGYLFSFYPIRPYVIPSSGGFLDDNQSRFVWTQKCPKSTNFQETKENWTFSSLKSFVVSVTCLRPFLLVGSLSKKKDLISRDAYYEFSSMTVNCFSLFQIDIWPHRYFLCLIFFV